MSAQPERPVMLALDGTAQTAHSTTSSVSRMSVATTIT